MTETQSSSDNEATPDTFVRRRSGEEAVRRAAQVIASRNNRTNVSGESGEKRTRRRSRRARSTPLLAGTGLQFHYAVGILLVFTLIVVAFSDKLGKKIWEHFHPIAAPLAPGQVAAPALPAPWWFRAEVPVLILGFAIWLYLTPGLWDRFKNAVGLNKDEKRLSRKRHQSG